MNRYSFTEGEEEEDAIVGKMSSGTAEIPDSKGGNTIQEQKGKLFFFLSLSLTHTLSHTQLTTLPQSRRAKAFLSFRSFWALAAIFVRELRS